MSRIQQWIAGTVVAVVAILAAGWFVAIAPQKHKASSVTAQAAGEEQDNSGLRTRVKELTAKMSAVPAEEASVAAVAAKIPADPELPNYVRALSTIASQTGVELISISPGVPTAVVVAAPTVQPTHAASGAATTSAAPAAAPAPSPVSLQAISLGIDVQGGYFQIQQFTAALQRLARTTVVTTLSIAPGASIKAAAAAPSAAAAGPSSAWKVLQANITADVFMNTSTPFTAIPVPSPAAPTAATPAAGASPSVTPLLPSAPSASASN